jgi:thiamine-phosphate pyrophosphorylase
MQRQGARDLPSLLVLTDRHACEQRGGSLPDTISSAVAGGAEAIVLREKDLPRADRAELARDVRRRVPCLLVASDIALADDVGADGVHLAGADPWPQPGEMAALTLVGRSCHDAHDVARARHAGVTYVTLSPIFLSDSKPGYGPALAPASLAGHATPVFALGGLQPGRVAACIESGAAGVAVMGAVMSADDPADVVRRLLDELQRARDGVGPHRAVGRNLGP